jgi:lysophospholipase L1-like esterase
MWRARVVTSAVAAALIVAAATPAARAEDTGTPPADPPPPAPLCQRVAVIGDSLTVGARTPLLSELARRGVADVVVDAAVSRFIPGRPKAPYSGVRAVRAVRAGGYQPDCFVVALGTNDVGLTSRRERLAARVDELLAEIGDLPVLWVNVWRPGTPTATDVFNSLLLARSSERPQFFVADWAASMTEHPQWAARDRVHLTRAGYGARAQFLADAMFSALYAGAAPVPPEPTCVLSSTRRLRVGDRGPDVRCAEQRLAELGYRTASGPDDRYTHSTAKVVREFQRHRGLGVTGSVNQETAAALRIGAPA